MATMDVTTELRLTELRKRNLRKTFDHIEAQSSSVLFLALQWKDIEEHFDSITKSISQRNKEVTLLEESIIKRFDEIQLREQKVESVQESVNQRFEEVKLKERSFEKKERLVFEEQSKELNLLRVSVKKQSREIEMMVQRVVEEDLEALQVKEKRFVLLQKSIEKRSKEVEVVQNSIKGSLRELELKGRQLSLMEKSVEERVKEIDLKERLIEMYSKELELNKKRLEERAKEHELKEKRFEERSKAFYLKEKGLEECSRDIELIGKILEECSKEVEFKEKDSEQCSLDMEANDKGFAENSNSEVQSEAFEKLAGDNAIEVYAPKHDRLCEITDGKSLQMFLNKQWIEHDLMHDEVLYALREASDPAKIVLDAMQGFYPLNADNGNTSIELIVVRKSCILLLEQVMRLSPEITPIVKGEATTLAFDWMTKMSPKAENHMECLGFLLLLAAYGLASAFDEDELVSQLVVVAQDRQTSELCRLLGLADKISDFIRNLIARKQHLDAIRLVYAFDLVGVFEPVPLIKHYLKVSEVAARKNCKMQNDSPAAQIEFFNKGVADVKAVIRCIKDHNLESKFPLKSIECSIAELDKKKANIIKTFQSSVPKPQPQQNCEKTCIIVAPHDPLLTTAPTSEPTPNVQEGQENGNKRLRTALSATDHALNGSLGATSSIYSVPFPNQKPSGFYTDRGDLPNASIRTSSTDYPVQPSTSTIIHSRQKNPSSIIHSMELPQQPSSMLTNQDASYPSSTPQLQQPASMFTNQGAYYSCTTAQQQQPTSMFPNQGASYPSTTAQQPQPGVFMNQGTSYPSTTAQQPQPGVFMNQGASYPSTKAQQPQPAGVFANQGASHPSTTPQQQQQQQPAGVSMSQGSQYSTTPARFYNFGGSTPFSQNINTETRPYAMSGLSANGNMGQFCREAGSHSRNT